MSAMLQAFQDAGYVPPADRLVAIANDVLAMSALDWYAAIRETWDDPKQKIRLMENAMSAVAMNPRNWDGAKDAVYAKVKDDPELLWALFEPYRLAAVHRLLTEAASTMHARTRAEAALKVRDVERKTTGPQSLDNPIMHASRASGMEAVARVARLSMLEMFKINNQPIGDLTPREANGWASSRERDARFVRLLTANLPENDPIRKHRDADEADRLYVAASVDD